MIPLPAYRGKAVGVFGLGKAGNATVRALLESGAEVYAWDDKEVDGGWWMVDSEKNPSTIHHPPFTIHYQQWPWNRLSALILSPGVPLTHPEPHGVVKAAQAANCPIIGEVELLYQAQPNATYIGITGTNGKSTTTTLIAHILKSAGKRVEVGGNLGTPALELEPLTNSLPLEGGGLGRGCGASSELRRTGPDLPPSRGKEEAGIYVLEMSSYQLDLIKTTRFNVAVLLNLTPDHLDRHGDMAGYLASKLHIFDRQQPDDVAVIAVDDAYTAGIGNRESGIGEASIIPVSAHTVLEKGVYIEQGILHDTYFSSPIPDPQSLIPISTLTGHHNWQNAAAAYAACRAAGVSAEDIMRGMYTYPGLAHRLELIATINNVRFINDSKATNADATQNALAPFENIYWILGGKAKAGGIESLTPFFPRIAHAYLIGDAANYFASTLGSAVPHTHSGTLENAVQQAAEMAFKEHKKDAVVLLSPACASFDQFRNFEERGDTFRKLVGSLQSAVNGTPTANCQLSTANGEAHAP